MCGKKGADSGDWVGSAFLVGLGTFVLLLLLVQSKEMEVSSEQDSLDVFLQLWLTVRW